MPPKRRRSAAAKAPAESAPAEPDPPAEAAASAAAAPEDDGLEAPAKRRRGRPAKDAAAAADDEGGGTSHKFQREIRAMMYGFGDDLHPLPQSVALVEDMAVDYLHQVLRRASDAAAERQRGGGGAARVQERDLLFAVRKDAKRVARLQELTVNLYTATQCDTFFGWGAGFEYYIDSNLCAGNCALAREPRMRSPLF